MNADWHTRAQLRTPAGVHSNARLFGAETVMVRGDGPWLWDSDGNRHVDYMLGRGPAFLGHAPKVINDAVAAAASEGLTLGFATPWEVRAAEAIMSISPDWLEQIRFTSSGTEAVQAAFRLARGATGRELIVAFDGLYHGWIDDVMLVPGPERGSARPATIGQAADSGANTILLPWNDRAAVEWAFDTYADQIAAVITEPFSIFGAAMPEPGFLAALREITTRHGAALIFDEVVSGFRLQPGSAASLAGVEPDLVTFAKAMASGWPVSAVAGRASWFGGVGEDRVRLSGTYNGNAAAMAAVVATVEATADGRLHTQASRVGAALQEQLIAVAQKHGLPCSIEGFPTAFWFVFDGMDRSSSDALAERIGIALRRHRVVLYHHTWLVSTAHDDEAITVTVDAFDRLLASSEY
jgi:glutamate-1-semialdehyde 2,1-aminomutase